MCSPGFNSILVILSKICCKESSGKACRTGIVRFSLRHCLIASRASRILFLHTFGRDLEKTFAVNRKTGSERSDESELSELSPLSEQARKRFQLGLLWMRSGVQLTWRGRCLCARVTLLAATYECKSMATCSLGFPKIQLIWAARHEIAWNQPKTSQTKYIYIYICWHRLVYQMDLTPPCQRELFAMLSGSQDLSGLSVESMWTEGLQRLAISGEWQMVCCLWCACLDKL